MDNKEIQQDICDFYTKLMKTQEDIRCNSLAAGWNLWPILSSYILVTHWKWLDIKLDMFLDSKDND